MMPSSLLGKFRFIASDMITRTALGDEEETHGDLCTPDETLCCKSVRKSPSAML